MSLTYNVGCGRNYLAGCVNVDLRRDVKVDVVWDMDDGPLPEQADRILLMDVLEHLSVDAVENVTRSLRVGGVVEGTTPHYLSRNAYNEFSHCRYISLNTFRDSYVFRLYRVLELKVLYEFTKYLRWSMPGWFVRFHERVFPGFLPPTRILFKLQKVKE